MTEQDLRIADGRGTEGRDRRQRNELVGVYSIQVPQSNAMLFRGSNII